jgi:hypothetical protein
MPLSGRTPVNQYIVQLYLSQSGCWESCLVQPISNWALSQIMAEPGRKGADAAHNLYQIIQGSCDSATLGGNMFKTRVHKFFQSMTQPRRLATCSLDNAYEIEFSCRTTHYTFGADPRFAGHPPLVVNHAWPLSPVFPNFDSFLYRHEMSQPSCQPLIGFRSTAHDQH